MIVWVTSLVMVLSDIWYYCPAPLEAEPIVHADQRSWSETSTTYNVMNVVWSKIQTGHSFRN
jgi:accessory gene regulator protein AgrB